MDGVSFSFCLCLCLCVHPCVRPSACVRACVRPSGCVRASVCVRACVRPCACVRARARASQDYLHKIFNQSTCLWFKTVLWFPSYPSPMSDWTFDRRREGGPHFLLPWRRRKGRWAGTDLGIVFSVVGVSGGVGFGSHGTGSNFSVDGQLGRTSGERRTSHGQKTMDKTGYRCWSFRSNDFIRGTRKPKTSRERVYRRLGL